MFDNIYQRAENLYNRQIRNQPYLAFIYNKEQRIATIANAIVVDKCEQIVKLKHFEQWMRVLDSGWAPSLIIENGKIMKGTEYV